MKATPPAPPRRRRAWALLALLCGLAFRAAFGVDPSDQLQFADGLFSRGLYEFAIREYRVVAERGSPAEAATALFRTGEAFKRMGRVADAKNAYRAAIARDPEHADSYWARLRLAELEMQDKNYTLAEDVLAALEKQAGTPAAVQPAVRALRARALIRLNRAGEAENLFRRIIHEHADSPYASVARVELAAILIQSGSGTNEVLTLLDEACQFGGSSPVASEALRMKADYLYRLGDFAGSAQAYATFFALFPESPEIESLRLPAAWALLKAKRVDEAIAWAGGREDTPEWLYFRANAEREAGRPSAAQDFYQRLLTNFPASAESQSAALELAALLYQASDYARARDAALLAKPDPSTDPDRFWILADCARQLGRLDEAVTNYDAAARSTNSDQAAAARFLAARVRQDQQRWEEAAKRYREMANSFPDHPLSPEARYAAGFCESQNGRLEAAVSDWTELIRRHPGHALIENAIFSKAQAERSLERFDDAQATLKRFLAEYSESPLAPEAYLLYGTLLERTGDFEGADRQYQQALLKNPTAELRRRILARRLATLQRLGKEDEALISLNLLVGLGAGRDLPLPLLEWAARKNLEKKTWGAALAAARVMIEVSPSEESRQIARYLEGRALVGLGRDGEAADAFRLAASLSASTEEGIEAAWRWGELALTAGRLEDAARAFEQAASLARSPSLADVRAKSYLGLARVYEMQQRWMEAARQYLAVGILYEDPEITPSALESAARAFERAGEEEEAARIREELHARYSVASP